MIKFFRKIRQQLLTENKLSKYLIYAIGEIVLVVIGILIALQINNWNLQKATQSKEQTYLKSLKSEFENNLNVLEAELQTNKQNRIAAIKIANYIDDESKTPTGPEFSSLLVGCLASDIEYKPSMAVLNEMINSGSMKDISNVLLKNQLSSWNSVLSKIQGQERILIQDRLNALTHLRKEGSMRAVFDHTNISQSVLELDKGKRNLNSLNLLSSKEFENDILLFIATNKSTENIYSFSKENIEKILRLLQEEIKK